MSSKLATVIADFTTQLASPMAIGATTATLQSATDSDGNALPNGTYFFSIDGSNSQKEHIVCTLSGTSLTGISSISRQGIQSSGCVRAHRIGAAVMLTDFATLRYLNDLLSGATQLDHTNPLTYDGTASITSSNQLATKAYVDGVAVSGAPNASTTVKGIGTVSYTPVSPTAPIFVGDNDPRMPTTNETAALAGTSGTGLSSSNKVVDNNDTGTSGAGKVLRLNGSGQIPALDASLVTGSPALSGANFTSLPGAAQVFGTITPLVTTAAANNDNAITTTFTPRLIKLHYWIQGHTQSGASNVFTSEKGVAVFNGTTLQFVERDWSVSGLSDNGAPSGNNTSLSFDALPDSTTSPTQGSTNASNGGGIQITLSIVNVSSTGFTIRCATSVQASNSNNARAHVSYEAFV